MTARRFSIGRANTTATPARLSHAPRKTSGSLPSSSDTATTDSIRPLRRRQSVITSACRDHIPDFFNEIDQTEHPPAVIPSRLAIAPSEQNPARRKVQGHTNAAQRKAASCWPDRLPLPWGLLEVSRFLGHSNPTRIQRGVQPAERKRKGSKRPPPRCACRPLLPLWREPFTDPRHRKAQPPITAIGGRPAMQIYQARKWSRRHGWCVPPSGRVIRGRPITSVLAACRIAATESIQPRLPNSEDRP